MTFEDLKVNAEQFVNYVKDYAAVHSFSLDNPSA
jgi:hypothetical protein